MALLWFSGCETGDLSEWVTGAGSLSATTAQINPGGGHYALTTSTINSYVITQSFAANATTYRRFYLQLHNLKASIAFKDVLLCNMGSGAGALGKIYVTTDASGNPSLVLYNVTGGVQVGSSFAVPLDTWMRVEAQMTVSASVGVLELKVNGSVVATGSNLNTGTTNTTADNLTFFNDSGIGTPTGTVYFDDYLINNTGYPGPGVSLARQFNTTTPNYNTFTKVGGATVDLVWDNTPFTTGTNMTDAVSTGKQTGVTSFGNTADSGATGHGPAFVTSNDTINGAKIGAVAKTGTASDAADSTMFRTPAGGSGVDTITAFGAGWATTDGYLETILATTPTAVQILNCEVGIQHNATTNTHTYEDAWLLIDFTPGSLGEHNFISPPRQSGMMPWIAPVAQMRATTAPFRAANLPDPYRQSMPPVPAIQQGMAPWQAPPIKAQWNVVFRAANLPDFYTWAMAPIPAWQAGMQQWWAPIARTRATTGDVNLFVALATDQPTPPLPFQAIQQAWWAPVPSLHPTITELHGATDRDWHPVGFPFQAIGQPWWAPVWALHPTITEFHGATELDFRPTGFPLSAIQQGWQLQYVRIPPYGPNDIGIVAIPIMTPTGFPRPAIQGTSQMAPIAGMSGLLGGVGPVVGADPIVVWRHRAGMQ